MSIDIRTENDKIIFSENNKMLAKLVNMPGGKKLPFGKEYTSYSIDFVAGAVADEEKAIGIIKYLVNYSNEYNIAIVNQMYGVKGANFKSADRTREAYKDLGFFVDKSSLWYIP